MADAGRRRPRTARQARKAGAGSLTGPPTNGDRTAHARLLVKLLTPQQIEVAVWYFYEGVDGPTIAGWLGCTKQAVEFRIKAIEKRLADHGVPLPSVRQHPYSTDKVKTYEVFDD